MPCSTDDRSKRRYDARINAIINTLECVTSNGNYTTSGVDILGNVKTDGYFLGDASFISNISYVNYLQNITLNQVTANGNTSSVGAFFGGDLEVDGYFIGDGSGIFNLPWQTNPLFIPNLQNVTDQGTETSHKVSFLNDITSLETYGNVDIIGNVTCSKLIGNGEFLDGVANVYELSLLDSDVSSSENKTIFTNTSGLTDVSKGDILTSTANGVLDKLSIGSDGQLLLVDTTTSLPKWDNITNIFNIEDRVVTLENKTIFNITKNLTYVTTGDILHGYGTDDLRRLARETTAGNTYLTSGDYGTGYGRLLRMNERGEKPMWLHPSNYDTYGSNAPIFTSGTSGTLNYINIELNTDRTVSSGGSRINISNGLFSIRFNDVMFYSENGTSFSGTGSTKHPSGVPWKWYTTGDIYGNLNGDGSKMVFPQFPSAPFVKTLNPSGAPDLGKAGQLLVFSDKRRKSKIQAMSTALGTLSKLLPKIYDKQGKCESGFIAQEMYYDVREMRHIVWPDRDANPNDDAPEPDYSDWGKRHACLRYLHFIAYVVRSIQELRERIERLKNNRIY